MKSLILVPFALMPAFTQAASLDVRIEGLRSTEGHLLFALTDSAAAWDGDAEARARVRQPVKASTEVVRVDDLPPGSYAVQVVHDANDNGRMDTNVIGMPTENYGFSQNPNVMRKARFEEARFELAADGGTIVIELR